MEGHVGPAARGDHRRRHQRDRHRRRPDGRRLEGGLIEPSTALLTGRVAVVTGAARAIGRATALALARFGAKLAICDRDGDGLGSIEGLRGVFDVRVPEAVDAFAAEVRDELGRVDVLVNDAGGTFKAGFLEVDAKGEDALVRENFSSVTQCVRAFVPLMEEGSSIVNVTSIEAHRAAPGYAIYAAMKAAVESLTRSLALELGERGIRVNAVAPDGIPSPGTGEIPIKTPLPVAASADDVAAAIVFLAGDGARFITGTTIHVDGGNHAAGGWSRSSDGTFAP